MEFVTNLELGKKIIIERYPEFNNCSFTEDNRGWDNFVIKIDDEYIFRFPKRDSSFRTIEMENNVLKHLNILLPVNIKVPEFIYKNLENDYPFVGYKMIKGKFLSEKLYNSFSNKEKDSFIKNMMIFINILHSIEIDSIKLDVVDALSNYQYRYNEFKEKCFEYFDNKLKDKTNTLFNNYFNDKNMQMFRKTIIHGDLSTDHIIITDTGIGIIDFGDTRVFDNAYDFQWLFLLDKNELDNALHLYNYSIDDYFHKRIKFYTSIIPYYGVVYALENNNKKMLEKEIDKIKKINLKDNWTE